jgi:S-formylglutathione hydrolase FrmB
MGAGWEARRTLPLRTWYLDATGACVSGPTPPASGARIVQGTLRSRWVDGPVGWLVALPHGHRPGRRLPVVYCLPGRGTSATGVLELHLDGFAAELAREGRQPLALVGVDSGQTYWHRRASGEDRMSMLLHDLMPMIERRFGLGHAGRGLFGWSMGGYGAILAAELHPHMFGALAALSPAMWQTAAQQQSAVPDAFDSTADYRGHDPYTLAPRLAGTPAFIACGRSDPFHAADVAFAQRLRPAPHTLFAAGCHDDGFWRQAAGPGLRFLGERL